MSHGNTRPGNYENPHARSLAALPAEPN